MPDSVIRNTFRKPEKLCSQVQIDRLFAEGKVLISSQFRLIYLKAEASGKPAIRVLIAVPKKKLKLAVSRNRMKRLVREAYRLNKHKLLESFANSGKQCEIAFIFTEKKCITQQETNVAINDLLDRLISTNEKNSE